MKTSIFFLLLSLLVYSCGKRYDNDPSVLMNFKVASAFDDLTNISDQAVTGDLVYYKSSGDVVYQKPNEIFDQLKEPCSVVITLDTSASPRILTVDYGNTNCDCNDGKMRRGKIITTFTGPYAEQGTVITHTTDNYYVNDLKIDGSKTVENMGLNASGQPSYSILIDGIATETTGETFVYSSTRERVWTEGFTTLSNRWDDVYEISGNSSGEFSTGKSYTSSTTTPITIKVGCPYPVSGTLQIDPSNRPVRVIDYGSGTCDNTFTVTINGNTFTIN